jgi:hypothetical protein
MHGQRWPVVGSLLSLVLLPLAASPPASPLAAPKQAPFSLAILRRDGILLPFVTYDGHWKNAWPGVGQNPDMPMSLAGIPKNWWPDKKPITDWNLVPIGTEPNNVRAVHAKSVNWYRAGCAQGIGLYTDYKPAILPPPAQVRPYPKDALAFSGDVQIDPIQIVGPQDPVVKALTDALPAEVTPKEEHAIELLTSHRWKHSYTAGERKNVPIQLEALYSVPKGREGRNFYYFEAVKRYFMPKDQRDQSKEPRGCDLVSFVSGWFWLNSKGLIGEIDAKVTISSCDYAQTSFMLPLGTVVIDDVRHWIVQWSNPTYESYAILKPIEDGMEQVVVTGGGACPRPEQD